VFVRGFLDAPVAGNLKQSILVGGPALQQPADVDAFKLAAPGFSLQAGLVGRLRLIGGGDDGRGSQMRFEEEEEP
jgi:hypothetical protein